jgi:membrane protein implicated in regulation of membrane protease activity
MKEVKKHVITAARFTLLVVGPASLIAGIILLVSNNDAVSIIIFFSVFAVDLLAATQWSRRQTARQKQKKGTTPLPEAQMTGHAFIAHMKMHPEQMPLGMTEFDLEYFRKLFSGKSQAGIDH